MSSQGQAALFELSRAREHDPDHPEVFVIGDIMHHRLDGGTLVIQGSSWLAHTPPNPSLIFRNSEMFGAF